MKYLSFILFISVMVMPALGLSQSVTVSPVAGHGGFSQSQYPLYSGAISVTSTQLTIGSQNYQPSAWSASMAGKKVGIMKPVVDLNLIQLDYNGMKLSETELEFFDPNDDTIAIYQFDDGRVVTRDNVANFTFFSSSGVILFSMSNSSQSPDGERESQLASDPNGKTLVLYNPVISYGATTGSRARVVFGEDNNDIFFRSDNRVIRQVKVTPGGSFITILTAGGNSDQAHVFDRFGNELFNLDLDEDQLGLSLSQNGEYLTAYSRGRIQVYNTLTGERIGSTSSRNPVLYATYIAEDETILSLGGSYSNNSISNPAFAAVHIGRRQIAREEAGFSLSAIDLNRIRVSREGDGLYIMKGLNRDLRVSARF